MIMSSFLSWFMRLRCVVSHYFFPKSLTASNASQNSEANISFQKLLPTWVAAVLPIRSFSKDGFSTRFSWLSLNWTRPHCWLCLHTSIIDKLCLTLGKRSVVWPSYYGNPIQAVEKPSACPLEFVKNFEASQTQLRKYSSGQRAQLVHTTSLFISNQLCK